MNDGTAGITLPLVVEHRAVMAEPRDTTGSPVRDGNPWRIDTASPLEAFRYAVEHAKGETVTVSRFTADSVADLADDLQAEVTELRDKLTRLRAQMEHEAFDPAPVTLRDAVAESREWCPDCGLDQDHCECEAF